MGPLQNQKLAHLYDKATSSLCLLCHQLDRQICILSGCQHASIQSMMSGRRKLFLWMPVFLFDQRRHVFTNIISIL